MSSDDSPSSDSTPGGGGQVSTNVARDLVHYDRSGTIRNEQQFLLFAFGYVSGYMADPDHFISGVGIGTSSSGKTHLQGEVERLWDLVPDDLYQATGGTDKSMVYDDDWDDAQIASLDELNKIPDALIEFLKSVHGGDEKFEYKTTTGSVREGFEAETIVREAIPYFFLYAQYEPDFEMWNRLLKIPVHESESKNRAVGAMAFDHDHIQIGDDDVEYGFDYTSGTRALQERVRDISREAPFVVKLPNGGEVFDWDVWEIIEPIFNHGRSEANRIYNMVANLIRASAVWNFPEREELDTDSDTTVLLAEPQDVANVLRCRDVLLATTHEIDRKKRAICTAIDTKSGHTNEIEGVDPILEHLTETDAPSVKKSELENILEDLQDNYLIQIHHGAGESGDDIYEFLGWDELGFARVLENAELFEDCTDPITGRPFLEAYEEQREQLDTDASELLGQAAGTDGTTSVSSRQTTSSSSSDDGGNTGLSKFGAGTDDDEPDVELTDTERVVGGYCSSLIDGERIEDLSTVPVEAFLGLVPLDEPGQPRNDPTLTPLDPDHDVWDRPDKADDWITSEQDARREIKKAIKNLMAKDVIGFETVHETEAGDVVDATMRVDMPDPE